MKAQRPLRVVGFFLDIGGCVRKDYAEIQNLYCRALVIQGAAVVAKPEFGGPERKPSLF